MQTAHAAAATTPATAARISARPRLTLENVYRAHFDFVWRSVRRLGLSEGEADDAVQDVFLVVHRRLADFEGRSSVRTWLFGIALRVVKDHRRRDQRAEQRVRAWQDPTPQIGPCPEDQVAKVRAVQLLDQLLDGLDEDKRAVFVLAEFEGLTAPEISAALDVKLNTVYSRLRLARERFSAALEDAGAAPHEPRSLGHLDVGRREPTTQWAEVAA